ncbi:type IV toxin-antitoxin system AbiEi family antitoxin domain-containing protein [Frankia sp. Cas3]|uniref:type IV toxin-antitoxin system AbiEi family antitoxin domain-containing protein n=1 Tax=Frankia sp. Cas3 TaxID=3073926 RepID=UPI002AD2FA2A|nr:type IV toxin-antitoxin system AbiEi family antitoxin domain-containing protein [Frankia sp. Cas3]
MISSSQARAAGLTRRQIAHLVRTGQWQRPGRGTYLVPGAHPLRSRVRAALLLRPDAVACEITAARLLGFGCLPTARHDEPVHLLLPRRSARRQPDGVVLHWNDLPSTQVTDVCGIPTTSAPRTLADMVLRRGRDDAVALMDAALRTGKLIDLHAARSLAVGRHGAPSRSGWWQCADGRAESPLETRLRLLLADGGLVPEQLQWPVRNAAGHIVARLDLAWPSRRLDVEADGVAVHAGPDALYRDRHRQNMLTTLGWTVLRFTWADVTRRADYVSRTVAHVLATSSQHP